MYEATVTVPATSALPDIQISESEWTYERYLELPDDGWRYEIIEGELYMANAPGLPHQFTVGEIFAELRYFVRQKPLGYVITAPFEVHLSSRTRPVQPDVFFVSKEKVPNLDIKFFDGVPDLVVEVISPSSIRTDRVVKFTAYEKASIPEYWVADPRSQIIEVYTLSGGGEYALHGQFGLGDTLNSPLLPELALTVDSLFS